MQIINHVQGSPEWHRHRAMHWNASDAPAMLGVSPFKTRAAFIREVASGVVSEVDDATQKRFNDGHVYEALARPLAEQIIGEDLYPITGVKEGTKLSASFDGLTLAEEIAFEHKSLNDDLRAVMVASCTGADLPEHYRVQMEQQCMVSGADRVLFMASKWDGETLLEERHCWYRPDLALRARIVAGWAQFDSDVTAYVPETASAPVVAAPVVGFGVLSLRVEGRVLASNLDTFKSDAEDFIARLPKPAELQSDQDFADADAAVKACEEAEIRIKAATGAALAQMADVDALLRTASSIAESIRSARLALDKAVKAEKENRRGQIVQAGVDAVLGHYRVINQTLGEYSLPSPAGLRSDMGAAIKGKRTIASLRDAIDSAVATAKIDASQTAERVRQNIAVLSAEAVGYETLFADRRQLVAGKEPDDLRNLVRARITEHEQQEAKRRALEASEAEVTTTPATAEKPCEPNAGETIPISPDANGRAGGLPAVAGTSSHGGARIKLGEINARIAPLTITSEGLASMGFPHVGTERSARLYAEADFEAICAAMARVLVEAAKQAKRAVAE